MAHDRAPNAPNAPNAPHHRAAAPDTTGSQSNGGVNGNPHDKGVGTYFLGRYRVVDEIGIGGMASVHLARMDGPGGFQKWVAIKRIHSHLVEDESFIQMFLDEARVAARISHPNVATVFELGKHEDRYWIAMEYLHGEPLREVMRRTEEIGAPMPPEIACRVIADAAEGLHAAHELLGKNGEKLGLVHRDVTPHNLFVTYDGTTKVVDFGIAKFSSRMSQTRAGTLKGKLAYMSPEQVHGETIDRRTDIFALGVVLWELTTGQRLFRTESDLDTLAKVQECNVPRPSTLVRGYPIDLEKIVMKALAKNRGERFKTAREFSRALQSLLMRRGLFIASDEVASYVQSIFAERIVKREAHLRWAAEVTQTISLDSVLGNAQSSDGSLITFNSEVQPSPNSKGGGGAPRVVPAAGMPPANNRGMSQSHPGGASAPPRPDTVRPPSRAQQLASTAETPQFDAPLYEDGPTIQGQSPVDLDYPPDDDFDDNDDTIVTMTKVEPIPGGRPGNAVLPAAGRPASPLHESGETRAASPNARQPSMNGDGGMFGGMQGNGGGNQSNDPYQVEPETLMQGGSGGMLAANPYAMTQPSDMFAGANPALGRQPLFAPPDLGGLDNRTMTAAALRRGLPMWAVAVASGLVALLFVGIIYAILASTSSPAKTVSPTPSGSAASPATSGLAGSIVAPPGTGPFGVARAAFSQTLVPPPKPTAQPAPTPTAPPTSAAPASSASSASSAPTPATTTPAPTAHAPTTATATTGAAAQPGRPTPLPAAAKEATGLLTIICKPACDQVFDNGRPLGTSPIFRAPVPVGEHRLQLKTNSPSLNKVMTVYVVRDDLKTVQVTMAP